MLVLASASPRRAALLRRAGLEFEVHATHVDEAPPPGAGPEEAVLAVARRKANAAGGAVAAGDVVLAADTEVVLDGKLLGKPRDADAARRMLLALAGRTHRVLTAVVALAADGARHEALEETRVTFRPLPASIIDAYVATGEPFDKAGGYALQGAAAAFVAAIEGDPSNVVGLPVAATLALLRRAGHPVPPPVEDS